MVSQNSIDDTIEENDFSVNRSVAGTKVVSSLNHSDNTNTDSAAEQLIQTGGSSGGDPYTRYLISGEQEFSMGLDNTDSNKLKIGPNAHPSTGTAAISVKPAGDVTFNDAYEFPTADGTSGQALVTDGAGNVDWGSTGGSGEVVQVAYAQTNGIFNILNRIPTDQTIPQQTEGVQVLVVTLSPKQSTSRLLVQFSIYGNPTGATGVAALFRDASANAFYATLISTGSVVGSGFIIIDSVSTASTTIKLRAGANTTNNLWVNSKGASGINTFGGVQFVTLSVTEIAV